MKPLTTILRIPATELDAARPALLVFAADRAQVLTVSARGETAARVPTELGSAWRLPPIAGLEADALEVRVESRFKRPRRVCVEVVDDPIEPAPAPGAATQASAQPAPAAHGEAPHAAPTSARTPQAPAAPPAASPNSLAQDRILADIAATLEARAGAPELLDSYERRFFARYDAWTTPSVRRFLASEANLARLTHSTRDFYTLGMPKLEVVETIAMLASLLPLAVFARVECLRKRKVWPRDLEMPDYVPPAVASKYRCVAEVVRELADYQKAIFDRFFQPEPDGSPPRDLQIAFALFASGRLRFVPTIAPGTRAASPMAGELNAEPDSTMFFAFAEFAWRAAGLGGADQEYWRKLARWFTGLQDVFLWTYARPLGRRDPDGFLRAFRRSGDPLPLDQILAHLDDYARFETHEALEMQMAYNAFCAYRDA